MYFHQDIFALPAERRLQHYALHFAKYAARLDAADYSGDAAGAQHTLADTLIIALAAANAAGHNLGTAPQRPVPRGVFPGSYRYSYIRYMGAIAKAAESFDHPHEVYDSMRVIRENVTGIAQMVAEEALCRGIDIVAAVEARWSAIETKARQAVNGRFVTGAALTDKLDV